MIVKLPVVQFTSKTMDEANPHAALTQLLQNLEAEIHHPGKPCSRERLMQLLHPEFHEVGRSGRKYSRTTVLEFLLATAVQSAPEPSAPEPSASEPSTRVLAWNYAAFPLANNAALLTYSSVSTARDGTLNHAAHRMSIWRLSANGWQLFYHQGTAVAAEELALANSTANFFDAP